MNTLIAATVALALAAFGVARGTRAVGGSDSSCYALMAQAFAGGDLQPVSRLATEAPWPNAALTLAPGGFIPSPVRPEAASPICAPGYSLLMATSPIVLFQVVQPMNDVLGRALADGARHPGQR